MQSKSEVADAERRGMQLLAEGLPSYAFGRKSKKLRKGSLGRIFARLSEGT